MPQDFYNATPPTCPDWPWHFIPGALHVPHLPSEQQPDSITLQPRQHAASHLPAPWAGQNETETARLLASSSTCVALGQSNGTLSLAKSLISGLHSLMGHLAAPHGVWRVFLAPQSPLAAVGLSKSPYGLYVAQISAYFLFLTLTGW